MRSPASSRPIDRRTVPRVISEAARCSGVYSGLTRSCGGITKDSADPTLADIENNCSASANRAPCSSPPSNSIVTTVPKAKALRPYAEHLITKAKKGGVHRQRQVVATIHDKDAANKLFEEIGPRYADRNGGYLRILKLGSRPGDRAPMARIELV